MCANLAANLDFFFIIIVCWMVFYEVESLYYYDYFFVLFLVLYGYSTVRMNLLIPGNCFNYIENTVEFHYHIKVTYLALNFCFEIMTSVSLIFISFLNIFGKICKRQGLSQSELSLGFYYLVLIWHVIGWAISPCTFFPVLYLINFFLVHCFLSCILYFFYLV